MLSYIAQPLPLTTGVKPICRAVSGVSRTWVIRRQKGVVLPASNTEGMKKVLSSTERLLPACMSAFQTHAV